MKKTKAGEALILPGKSFEKFNPVQWRETTHHTLGRGITFDISQMYECPGIKFSDLELLSEFFGTNEIDWGNDIHSTGCETCDYGSEYGYTFHIYKITKNTPFK